MANDASQNPVDWPSLAKSLVSALSRPEAGQRELVPTQVLEVCAGAFAAGFARGRWGKVEVGGVPVDLGAGVLLHLLALSGVSPEHGKSLHNLAEGALATYFATWGAAAGRRVRLGEELIPFSSLPFGGAPGWDKAEAKSAKGSNGALAAKDNELLEFIHTIVPN